jgi:c-di-GMP-binding flagellar brake protein YcgR
MEPADKTKELEAGPQNLRAVPRFEVEADALLLLVAHGATLPCRVVDLSLSGCRLRTRERFPAGAKLRVEVTFRVRGLAFRFCGVTQWTDGRNQVGVRFVDLSERRKEEFLEAIGEVEAEDAAKRAAEREAAEEEAAAEQLAAQQASPPPVCDQDEPLPISLSAAAQAPAEQILPTRTLLPLLPWNAGPQRTEQRSAGPSLVKPSRRERRSQWREGVDNSASIFLVNAASRLNGRILDLSLGGCQIQTEELFPVGIFTRVEAEFRLEGMPFRLGGVIQAIHDRHHVGIRFLDMSSRKKEQLELLIEEIEDLKRSWDRE